MALTTATLNAAVDYVASLGRHVSVHTADPGGTGAAEATGGSYGRKPTTWAPATGGDSLGSEVVVALAAGRYSHYGVWTSAVGGTFLHGGLITNAAGTPEVAEFTSAGELKVTPVLDGLNPA